MLGSQNRTVSQFPFSLDFWESVRNFIPSDKRKLTKNKVSLLCLLFSHLILWLLSSPCMTDCSFSPPFSSPLLSATDKVLLIKLRGQNGLNWDFCSISDSDLNSALTCICLWPGASEPLGPSEEGGPRDQGLEWELETLRGPALGSRKYGLLKKRVSTKLESILFFLSPEDPIWSHSWVEVKWRINYPGGRKLCNNKRHRERRQKVPRSFLHELALSLPFHLF